MLKVRKLADRRGIVDPTVPPPLPLPLLGVRIEGETPRECRVPTSWVARGIAEGWIEGVNGRPVVRPAGPTQEVWDSSHTGQPHVFTHYDTIVIKCLDGDVRYRVTHQPDKYVDSDDPDEPVTPEIYAEGRTRVDHWYGLELED